MRKKKMMRNVKDMTDAELDELLGRGIPVVDSEEDMDRCIEILRRRGIMLKRRNQQSSNNSA